MGCDAHPCIEIRGRNGRWGMRDSKHRYWKLREKHGWGYEKVREMRPSYMNALSDRNYALFGVLAGVRWRSVNALFDHRGFPDDVSKATLKEIPQDGDYHSHTYFTVQELLDTDWDKVAVHLEMSLFADQFLEWKETGVAPDGLVESDYVSGRSMWYPKLKKGFHRQVTEEEMTLLLVSTPAKKLVKLRKPRHSGDKERLGPYVNLTLPRTYADVIPEFVSVIPDLESLGPPDRVRVVIAFDN